jgi:SRSO17 transposase
MELMNPGAVKRLETYFGRIGDVLGVEERRASFATYAMGIFSDAERKSAEPIAARASPDPKGADAAHQRLLHFLGVSEWSDLQVRAEASRHALSALTEKDEIEAWIIDDTGFLKQGTHSVGVQRQYTGSAGKVTNCQIGVSLTLATRSDHVPIDFELYLPKSWTTDRKRRKEARIPVGVAFATKPELGLQMIRRALESGLPRGTVLADAAYGGAKEFRAELRQLALDYAVAVNSTTNVRLLDRKGICRGRPRQLKTLALQLMKDGAFRRCTWRQGSRRAMTAQFARVRVQVGEEEQATLLIEWRDHESEPANYFFISMAKLPASNKQLVSLVMQRWRTERTYQDLKGELGLDHYEGRSYPGWHHHISVVLACYAFVVAERVRRFPPSARGARSSPEDSLATGEALHRQLHHCPACGGPHHRHLASPLSDLPSKEHDQSAREDAQTDELTQ